MGFLIQSTDSIPPSVTGQAHTPNATGVSVSTTITATFSEAVQPGTISFTLQDSSGRAIPTSLAYANQTATLTPRVALAYSTTYTAALSGAEDLAGNTMTSVSWSFTTAADTPPTVTAKSPASGATGVSAGSSVTATFSEAVQQNTISFVLKDSGGYVLGSTVSYNSSTFTATLTPVSPMAYSTQYTASLSGAKDTAGNTMSPVSWSFTTTTASSSNSMVMEDFNGPSLPVNKEGNLYPDLGGPYDPHFGGGTGTVSLNSSDAITGNSIQFNVTAGELYAEFNPYDGVGRDFARVYRHNPAGWQFNTYNRMSFWIKAPTSGSPLTSDG